MRRFGLIMAKLALPGPAKRLWQNNPEDMTKMMLIMCTTSIVTGLHSYFREQKAIEDAYNQGVRQFELLTKSN